MSVRFRICLAAWMATVVCAALSEASRGEDHQVTDDWSITISPARGLPPAAPAAGPADAPAPNGTAADQESAVPGGAPGDQAAVAGRHPVVSSDDLGETYRRIYEAIPFNRAEYNVNPSYRHDATMEILTGHPRHRTIVTHSTRTGPAVRPRPSVPVLPYRYNNPSRGLNYYFYFPYWNYRGIY